MIAPGALSLTADQIADNYIVPLIGPAQSAGATIANLAQKIASLGLGNVANTNITTVGAGTLTAAALEGGLITRSGSTAAYTDTTATAAEILAAIGDDTPVGTSWLVWIKNTVAFPETLAGGTDVTLSGQTIIPPLSAGLFLVTLDTASTVTMRGIAVVPLTTAPIEAITALSTVGAGTVTAAGIVGGVTARGGAQSATAFTDTTDTAALIIAAMPNASIGASFEWVYRNNTDGAATLAGGVGVTVSGMTIVPKNSWVRYLVTYTAAATITVAAVDSGPTIPLPPSKYVTGAAATFAAGDITGAYVTNYMNSGNNATLTTRTATQMFGDIPNCQVGHCYQLNIRNTHGTTATITAADASVTLTGTMTIAQNVTRLFNVVFTSATACTITSMGISAAAA